MSTKTGRVSPFVPRPSNGHNGHNGHNSGSKKHKPHSDHKPHEHHHDDPLLNGHAHVTEEKSIEIVRSKTVIEVERETKTEVLQITTELLELITIGENDVNGVVIVERGEHFLESIMRRFQLEFFERWKVEFLFPTIKCWLEKHIVQYVERIIVMVREKLIKEYDEQIIILKEKHRCEMEERERHHREIYLAAIRRAWESYEKSMEEIEFVKEVRFKYRATEERQAWAEIIKELAPEMIDCVPKCYAPEFRIDERQP